MFNAAYGDDEDALHLAIEGFPEYLVTRQNRPGQRASLAHAAAAGGAVRVAPNLMLAMHAAAIKVGKPALADELAAEEKSADGADELTAARLRTAVAYCCRQRDVLGRTPLHYAARAGHLRFVQWAVKVLCTRPKAATEALLGMEGAQEHGGGAVEIRRGVVGVKLPGAAVGPRRRMLVSLSVDALRLYALPAAAGGSSAGTRSQSRVSHTHSLRWPRSRALRLGCVTCVLCGLHDVWLARCVACTPWGMRARA